MKLIFTYVKKFKWMVTGIILLKIVATFLELLLPYVLKYLVDDVAPLKDLPQVLLWGAVMLVLAVLIRFLNVFSNRRATKVSEKAAYAIRRDLFWHSVNLSGRQMDEIGLPSLTSRMTADSYNVQDFIRVIQTMGIRAPMMLLGGVIVTMVMDVGLSLILCVIALIAVFVVIFVSVKGIPLYDKVQRGVDDITRVMRENITGIRVVKALSKEEYEKRRFSGVNEEMSRDRKSTR